VEVWDFTSWTDRIDTGFALAKWAVVLIAVGVGVYLIRSLAALVRPALVVAGWLTGIQPGSSVAAGLTTGVRLFVLAAVMAGAAVWFIKDWL